MYDFKYKMPLASFNWLLPPSKSTWQKSFESARSTHVFYKLLRLDYILHKWRLIPWKWNWKKYFWYVKIANFYKQTFSKEHQPEIGKNLNRSLASPRGWTLPPENFENSWRSSSILLNKTYRTYSQKINQKNKCVCFDEVIWLIKMKKVWK